jgi:hypothetical protein
MKKYSSVFATCLVYISINLIHSCKKSNLVLDKTPQDSVVTQSFVEEFKDVTTLLVNSGWINKDFTNDTIETTDGIWGQGQYGIDKSGEPYGLAAFSGAKDEYVYSSDDNNSSISSWLITPVLSVKNGDRISFYTSGSPNSHFADRMEVLMNKSGSSDVGNSVSSVGSFSTLLFDINADQSLEGYPSTWTKYEYTFTGIDGKMETRIAFRHYDLNPIMSGGIGIDVFEFQVR